MSCRYGLKPYPLFISLVLLSCTEANDGITTQAMTRSILNNGDTAMFGPLYRKLHARKCIHVVIIGGSVTLGRTLPEGSPAYPAIFEALLNSAFPCEQQHNVTTISKAATASDYWINYLVGRQKELLAGVDLVVVDTAMNDVKMDMSERTDPSTADLDQFIRIQNEILMSLLLHESMHGNGQRSVLSSSSPSFCASMSNYMRNWTGIAAIWLGTSTRRTEIWRGPLPRSTDAVHIQLPVAITHGVPYISVIDGLGPFASAASERWLNNTWYGEPTHNIHPGPWGHRALAGALIHFLREQNHHLEHLPWREPSESVVPYCPRSPVFVDPTVLRMYLDTNPLHISTLDSDTAQLRMVQCQDWHVISDVVDKPGLLSNSTGARCTVLVFAEEVVRHPVMVGEVHVLLLKSYEHMGRVRVTVAAVPASRAVATHSSHKDSGGSYVSTCVLEDEGSSDNGTRIVLGSRDMDCLWQERVSEARAEAVQIAKPPQGGAAVGLGEGMCLTITFEVLASERSENKVKILSVTLF